MLQQLAWVISVIGIMLLGVLFLYVYKGSTETKEYDSIQKKWYKVRKYWFITLVSVMSIATFFSLRNLPYHDQHDSELKNATKVKVGAYQFGWDMSQLEFTVGETIEFDVTSKDVNHGFGIYNDKDELLAQVQAMPRYTNKLFYTFEKAGTYKILCLEYCNVGHHMMIKTIVVKDKGGLTHGH